MSPMNPKSPPLRIRSLGVWAGAVLALLAGVPGADGSGRPEGLELVERYCFDCHADGVDKGDIALDSLVYGEDSDARQAGWKKAWKMARHELMPPVDKEAPTDAERHAITRWIEGAMLGIDHENPDPGRVTMRRLNRMEYEYSVTDLFGTEIVSEGRYSSDGGGTVRLRDRLPPDDTAFGFDNIGDFQTLSPALLEKYFTIAEFVIDQVISFDGPEFPVRALDGRALVVTRPDGTNRAEHVAAFDVGLPGRYRIEIDFTLGGWQDFGGAYQFALRVDEHPLAEERIDVGGQETHQFAPVTELDGGEHQLVISTDALEPDSRGKWNPLELRPRIRIVGPMDEGTATYPEPHRRIFFDGEAPGDEGARRLYAREVIRRVVDRAFRRPADDATLDRLAEIAMRHEQFERGVGEALTAALTSLRFLFRSELQPQPDDPEAVHAIDEFALASRLSYLLWLSLPDAELSQLAASGTLRQNLRPQVDRMLADPKSARFFEDFPGQWLRTRNVLMTAISRRDDEINPVRSSMKSETEKLFEYIARQDRDLVELVTADYSFLNGRLAEYYGVDGVEGDAFRKVSFAPGSQRGGLLTHGSFLVSTSNPNRTSPVKRGLYVLENLLAVEPPPPPPDIPALEEPRRGDPHPKSVREQLVLHREKSACAACHAHFDPIGLVLENYDVIGRWRDEERGEPIAPRETTTNGDILEGIDDLKRYFAAHKDRFYRGTTEKLMTYALGRGLEPADAVTVDRIAGQLMEEGGKFSTLLMAVVESPAFQTRRGDDGRAHEPQRSIVPAMPPPEMRKGRKFRPQDFPAAQERPNETTDTP
ncbi:hypothetical protein BH23VER1_BH23VER1_24000 [soil metagenome]